jgi:RimJ/RimL family protein N-acetyltransferase
VLAGTQPGQVWVDNLAHPRVGFLSGSEGQYLAGDPEYTSAYAELREVIPCYACLLVDTLDWEPVLKQVWKNPAARRHHRQHYLFCQKEAPAWREHLPEGVRAVNIDADFFKLGHLENFDAIEGWLEDWGSHENFLARGCGTCLVISETIASHCLMDCAVGDRCEIGICTDIRYRRQGLAKLAVAATLEACLTRGYREIGWQCLRSNAGSIATAKRTGFAWERDYILFSNWIPAENAGDMTPEECADWAEHFARASQNEVGWAWEAMTAWALAGQPQRAIANLRLLREAGWKARPEWVRGNWRLSQMWEVEEFQQLMAEVTQVEN